MHFALRNAWASKALAVIKQLLWRLPTFIFYVVACEGKWYTSILNWPTKRPSMCDDHLCTYLLNISKVRLGSKVKLILLVLLCSFLTDRHFWGYRVWTSQSETPWWERLMFWVSKSLASSTAQVSMAPADYLLSGKSKSCICSLVKLHFKLSIMHWNESGLTAGCCLTCWNAEWMPIWHVSLCAQLL